MRVIDADKLKPDCMTKDGRFAISQSQIANAKPIQTSTDAVSRQDVNTLIDELARAISDERCCISRGRSTATIMQDILDLPPVTPTHKSYYQLTKEAAERM